MNSQGQVLVEALIALTLMLVVLVGMSELDPVVQEQHAQLTSQRDGIWSRLPEANALQVTDDYPSANGTGLLLAGVSRLVPLDFEYRNLWQTTSMNSQYPMVRLTNPWSASSFERLSDRPRLLVANSLLSGDIAGKIQNFIAGTWITEELSSDSLIFGHIDSDVVPEAALQER